jgi:hypothetical protein
MKKIKFRYLAAGTLMATSIALTPLVIAHAYAQRGYTAYGGEWLVPILGLLAVWACLEIGKAWDKYCREKKECERMKRQTDFRKGLATASRINEARAKHRREQEGLTDGQK